MAHNKENGTADTCTNNLATLEDLESVFTDLQSADQQASVLRFMVERPHSYTDVIAREAGSINVPDTVKHLRPKLERYGFAILHYAAPRENRFGGMSSLHKWYVGRLPKHPSEGVA